MTTGYTREQLFGLTKTFHDNVPPDFEPSNFEKMDQANDLAMAGTEVGILLRLAFKGDNPVDFFLNCVVTLELLTDLYAAGVSQGWWLKEYNDPVGWKVPPPSREDGPAAMEVLSFRVATERDGVMLAFSDGQTVFEFRMCRKIVADVLTGIQQAADKAQWWDEKKELLPVDRIGLQ
jgi:hypothetical protein